MKLPKPLKQFIKSFVFVPLKWANKLMGGIPTQHGFTSTSSSMGDYDLLYLALGHYERDERSILKAHFLSASTIIEIGSNIGVVAVEALETRLSSKGRMICVEPNPFAIDALRKNLDRSLERESSFGQKRVEIVNAALCSPKNETGELKDFFARPNLASGLAGQVRPTDQEIPSEKVRAISLSGILDRFNITSSYSLIIDAEGAEIPMIFEDAAALKNCTQIAIEIHSPELTGSEKTVQDIAAELTRLGFAQRAKIRSNYYFERAYI
jgi:FkbM family methyltransferase